MHVWIYLEHMGKYTSSKQVADLESTHVVIDLVYAGKSTPGTQVALI